MYKKCFALAIMVAALSSSSAYSMKMPDNNGKLILRKMYRGGISGAENGIKTALLLSFPIVFITKDSSMPSLAYPIVAAGLGMAGGFILGAGASLTYRNWPTANRRAAIIGTLTGTAIGLGTLILFNLDKI